MRRMRQGLWLWVIATAMIASGGVLLALAVLWVFWFVVVTGVLLMAVAVYAMLPGVQRKHLARTLEEEPPHYASIEPDGFEYGSVHDRVLVAWPAVIAVAETPELVLVCDDDGVAYAVPKAAFATPADAETFVANVRGRANLT